MINIAVEGVDGVGKTTLCRNLCEALKKTNGVVPITLVQPNNIIRGLRESCKHPWIADIDLGVVDDLTDICTKLDNLYKPARPSNEAAALMMLASMAQTRFSMDSIYAQLTRVSRQPVFIHDRSVMSTIVYQAIVPGNIKLIDSILSVYIQMCTIRMDLTIVVTGDSKSIEKRVLQDGPYDKTTELTRQAYASAESMIRVQNVVTHQNLASFYWIFPKIVYIDTSVYNEQQTVAKAMEHIKECLPSMNLR